MDNKFALAAALMLAAAAGFDLLVLDGAASLELGRKLLALLDWLAVWR